MPDASSEFLIRVPEAGDGVRLDTWISTCLPEYSRSFVSQLIREGCVEVDGRFKKPGARLKTGEEIHIRPPQPRPATAEPEAIPVRILYEDADLIVINKTAGMVVHPAPGHSSGTLVNALLHHIPDLRGVGMECRPGIVHRLDKDTSGVLVAAKNHKTMTALSAAFKSRTVRKTYLALVHGGMESEAGAVRLPVGRHPTDRKKMSVNANRGREAETRWRVRERFTEITLLELDLLTGRTHQIRVHCAAIGHPVIGDPVYAPRRILETHSAGVRFVLQGIDRQLLHAWKIGFHHPSTEKWLDFEAETPFDMKDLMEKLLNLKTAKE